MEVNKEQAELCRDRGAQALRSGDFARSVKMLEKSLRLYPLPGVDALLAHAKSNLQKEAAPSTTPSATAQTSQRASNNTGSDGRPYTDAQAEVVKTVLRAKQSGRKGAHYRILRIEETASESEIKKAYRKLSLKVHPDKNPAPQADDAFKAVSLAYATLSDENKRAIYDRYGDEDPDNRGGNGGMHMRHGGQDVSPEDLFNAFFGHMHGMPRGGGGGVHFRTNGFGPGFHFQAGGPRPRQREGQEGGQQAGFGSLLQLLPILLFLVISFSQSRDSSYEGRIFSLTKNPPFLHTYSTKYTRVTDIPYFVTLQAKRTYFDNPASRKKIEEDVERSYESFLVKECKAQKEYKRRLVANAQNTWNSKEREKRLRKARAFEVGRCDELAEFFPDYQRRYRF